MSKNEEKLMENLVEPHERLNIPRIIIVGVQELTYVLLLILAITTFCGVTEYWGAQQARTVIIGACCGAVGIWGTTLVEKIFKVKIGLFVDIVILLDLFFSIVLGEACQVFLNVTGYDKILHAIGTAELALVGYVVAKFFLAKTNKGGSHQVVYALIFGFFFALGVQMLWELYEFSFDMIAGTNMQKYLPDQFQDYMDLTGSTWQISSDITDEELLEFYRYFYGFHYAVEDTMFDVVADVVGATLGITATGLVFHFFPSLQDSLLREKNKVVEKEIEIETPTAVAPQTIDNVPIPDTTNVNDDSFESFFDNDNHFDLKSK